MDTKHSLKLKTVFSTNNRNDTGVCPLKDNEIAIFPVRYAIDDDPQPLNFSERTHNESNSTHYSKIKIPSLTYPNLESCRYTFRQVRDGWLYIYSKNLDTIYEYIIKNHYLILNNSFTMSNELEETASPQNYLVFQRDDILRLAYSPVQYTKKSRSLMFENQSNHDPIFDPREIKKDGNIYNARSLESLGEKVSDIKKEAINKPAPIPIMVDNTMFYPTFQNTRVSVSTSSNINNKIDSHASKQYFSETLIRGAVPCQNSSFMIGVLDPYGIVEDLSKNLSIMLIRKSQFESENQNKFNIAKQYVMLIGGGSIYQIYSDPIKQYNSFDQFYCIFNILQLRAIVDDPEFIDKDFDNLKLLFQNKWGFSPSSDKDKWSKFNTVWREAIKYRSTTNVKELISFLDKYLTELSKIDKEIEIRAKDLTIFIEDQFSIKKETILTEGTIDDTYYLDLADNHHTLFLLETIEDVFHNLSMSQHGSEWLTINLENPRSWILLPSFGFNKKLYFAVKKLIDEYCKKAKNSQTEKDINEENFPQYTETIKSILLNPQDILQVTQGIKTTGDILSIDFVKSNLTTDLKKSLDNLCELFNQNAKNLIERLATAITPKLFAGAGAGATLFTHTAWFSLIKAGVPETQEMRLIINRDADWQEKVRIRLRNKCHQEIIKTKKKYNTALHPQEFRKLDAELDNLYEELNLYKKTNKINRVVIEVFPKGNPNYIAQIHGKPLTEMLDPYNKLYNKLVKSIVIDTKTAQKWVNSNFGGILPLIVVSLSIWNLANNITKETTNEKWAADITSTGGAVVELWAIPMFNNFQTIVETRNLTNLTIQELKQTAPTQIVSNVNVVAKNLGMMYAITAISSAIDAYQIYTNEIPNTTNNVEKFFTYGKVIGASAMSITASIQLGVILSECYPLATVMSSPFVIAMCAATAIYLICSYASEYYKRNDIENWLANSFWGVSEYRIWAEPTEENFQQSSYAIQKILRAPIINITGTHRKQKRKTGKIDILEIMKRLEGREAQGFWLEIILPPFLKGKNIKIAPAYFDKNKKILNEISRSNDTTFYDNYGFWIRPPYENETIRTYPLDLTTQPKNYLYYENTDCRRWNIHIENTNIKYFDIEIYYPKENQNNPIFYTTKYKFNTEIKIGLSEIKSQTDYIFNKNQKTEFLDARNEVTLLIP